MSLKTSLWRRRALSYSGLVMRIIKSLPYFLNKYFSYFYRLRLYALSFDLSRCVTYSGPFIVLMVVIVAIVLWF